VFAANLPPLPATEGDHVTAPVYWGWRNFDLGGQVSTAVAPATGAVSPETTRLLTVVLTSAKVAVTTPELAGFVTDVAPATVKKFVGTPVNV